jgi:probable HAF family extracellular repeat protein
MLTDASKMLQAKIREKRWGGVGITWQGKLFTGALVLVAAIAVPLAHAAGYTITDLGTLGRNSSFGHSINNAGQVTGQAGVAGGDHAFIYTPGSGMQDLGTLGGTESRGYGINKLGQVVGSFITTSGSSDAFFYAIRSGMVDLNTLLPIGSGWQLGEADGINDSGQITGQGMINGQTHAFLLTPVPLPGAIWLVGSGLFGLVGFARRKAN